VKLITPKMQTNFRILFCILGVVSFEVSHFPHSHFRIALWVMISVTGSASYQLPWSRSILITYLCSIFLNADDAKLYKHVLQDEDHTNLQTAVDSIQEWMKNGLRN